MLKGGNTTVNMIVKVHDKHVYSHISSFLHKPKSLPTYLLTSHHLAFHKLQMYKVLLTRVRAMSVRNRRKFIKNVYLLLIKHKAKTLKGCYFALLHEIHSPNTICVVITKHDACRIQFGSIRTSVEMTLVM